MYKAFFKFRHISMDIGGAKKNIEKPEELAVTVFKRKQNIWHCTQYLLQ